jgi:hypothetical protein
MAEAVPLCILRGRESYAAEWIIPDAAVFDAEGTIDDYRAFRLGEGKAKGPRCRSCLLDSVCEGPWREYPERFGWTEFEPRRDARARAILAETARAPRGGAAADTLARRRRAASGTRRGAGAERRGRNRNRP